MSTPCPRLLCGGYSVRLFSGKRRSNRVCRQLKSCVITPCGHNFCQGCIAECLNRKHCCPLCNKECLIKQCYPNLQLDNLLKVLHLPPIVLKCHVHVLLPCVVNDTEQSVLAEKEKASKKYFEDLFKKSGEHVATPLGRFAPLPILSLSSEAHFAAVPWRQQLWANPFLPSNPCFRR
jgi:hypothetical protein